MLKQLPDESDDEFDERLHADLILRHLLNRAVEVAKEPDKADMPKDGAARILEAASKLRAGVEHRAPTWAYLIEVVGLAGAIPPHGTERRSAKRAITELTSAAARVRGMQNTQEAEERRSALVTLAKQLADAGVRARNLVGTTARKFPDYSPRQVRRILQDAGMVEKRK